MKLSTATLACLPRRVLNTMIDYGCLSKSEVTAIQALRSGSRGHSNEAITKRRLETAIQKQFAEHRLAPSDAARAVISDYAYSRPTQILKETLPMPTPTEQKVAKDQAEIEDANTVLERLTKEGMHAGKTRAKAMSDAAMSPEFSEAHRKERARKYGA